MKEVIYNENNIKDNEINRIVRRAKALIENDKGEILLANSFNNYQLPGGHIEDGESFAEGLIRETFEETGIEIKNGIPIPFITIYYMNKDYPIKGINTKCIGNYYNIKTNELAHTNELTSEEKMGNFKLEYINKNIIIKKLEDSLSTCTSKNTVLDTILVIKEYLSINK